MQEDALKPLHRRALLRKLGAAAGVVMAQRILSQPDQAFGITNSENKAPRHENLRSVTIPTWYYQHFDADYDLEVPEEGFGGWKKTDLEFSRTKMAVVVMHAWDMGTKEKFPGWWRAVPYAPRSYVILREVFPRLLKAVRDSGLSVFHVAGGSNKYWQDYPGYKRAASLAGPEPPPLDQVASDPLSDKIAAFRKDKCFVGQHNTDDVDRGIEQLDFAEEARPKGSEGVAENSRQLFALCREQNINHLVYCGFAINWCLLLSPGGMAEMNRHGVLCSVIRQATTAVENKQTARNELCKEIALWRVALAFGFVFDVDDFIGAIGA